MESFKQWHFWINRRGTAASNWKTQQILPKILQMYYTSKITDTRHRMQVHNITLCKEQCLWSLPFLLLTTLRENFLYCKHSDLKTPCLLADQKIFIWRAIMCSQFIAFWNWWIWSAFLLFWFLLKIVQIWYSTNEKNCNFTLVLIIFLYI